MFGTFPSKERLCRRDFGRRNECNNANSITQKGRPTQCYVGRPFLCDLRICNMQKRNREHTRKSDDLLAFVQAGLAEDGPFGNVH